MMENGSDRALLKRIYRVSFRGGRRLPAFIFDCFFLCSASFFGIYLAVRPHFKNRTAAGVISSTVLALAVLVFIAVRRMLFERHVERMRRSAREEVFSAKLLMEPGIEKLLSSSDPSVFVSRSVDALSADEVKEAYLTREKPVTVVAFAEPTDAAKKLIAELSGLTVKTPLEHFGREKLGFITVDESETDAHLLRKHSGICAGPRFRKELFVLKRERAAKYVLLGAALMLMSFFMRYAVYYRTVASIVLSIGASVFAADAFKKNSKEKTAP